MGLSISLASTFLLTGLCYGTSGKVLLPFVTSLAEQDHKCGAQTGCPEDSLGYAN